MRSTTDFYRESIATLDESIDTGQRDFADALLEARHQGWRTYKGPDKQWAHACPSCVEEPREGEEAMSGQEFEFHEVVARVEERFRPVLDSEAKAKLGALGGDNEGRYEPKMVSTGWWVVLAQFGVAVRFGSMKPDIAAGDTLVLIARRIPKKPDEASPIVVGPAPPPSFSPAELRAIRSMALSAAEDGKAGDLQAVLQSIVVKTPEVTP